MIDFGTSLGSFFVATLVPAFVGLFVITSVGRVLPRRYVAGFAFGVLIWFFLDTIEESGNLGVVSGFGGGIEQVALVVLFGVGLLLFLSLDGGTFSPNQAATGTLLIPLLVAFAVGMHGFGEGTAFGGTSSSTNAVSLVDAFGGVDASIAYVLHKVLEPTIIGACYAAYAQEGTKPGRVYVKEVVALAIAFIVPSMVGSIAGYFVSYDASYFFAIGAGATVYAAARVVRPLFGGDGTLGTRQGMTVGVAIFLGLLCIYVAALFHS